MARWVVAAMVLIAFAASGPAAAEDKAPTAADLPSVRLLFPGRVQPQARTRTVRVLTELRDCSARPTVTVVASWRGRSGPVVLVVDGVDRVISLAPRPAARRTDRFEFRRVRVVRGVARLQAKVVTNWRRAAKGRVRCEIRLPRLVGSGDRASAAQRGLNRLRVGMDIRPPSPTPQRVTSTDHLWACGAGRTSSNECGVLVTAGPPVPPRPDPDNDNDSDGDPSAWALALLATVVAGGGAAAAARRPEE